MRVAEHFYSIQGEGPSVGVPAVFLRLGGCNLLCGGDGTLKDRQLHDGATWRCDTIEVWSKHEKLTPEEAAELLFNKYAPHFVYGAHLIVTGGEPLQQEADVSTMLRALRDLLQRNIFIEVETNGTIAPHISQTLYAQVKQWNVSPKLANSGMPAERRIKPDALQMLKGSGCAFFKFVVGCENDVQEAIRDFIRPMQIARSRVWLMPAAGSRAELIETIPAVAEAAKRHGFRLSSRLQLEIWDRATGV